MLHARYTGIENWRDLCVERFTGTPEEMEERVNRVSFMGPDWCWSDAEHTAIHRLAVTTHTLAFAMIHVGMGEITADNAERVWSRLAAVEAVHGAFRVDGDKSPVPFTWDDVRAHVGLRVNVADENDRTFASKVRRWKREQAARAASSPSV